MHLQTDQELQQNEIKILNSKFNLQMFSTRIRDGKAFAVEQKIREFKKLLFKSKRIQKKSSSKRIDAKKLIQNETDNLNSIASTKYDHPPEEIEMKNLKDYKFREIYNFF